MDLPKVEKWEVILLAFHNKAPIHPAGMADKRTGALKKSGRDLK